MCILTYENSISIPQRNMIFVFLSILFELPKKWKIKKFMTEIAIESIIEFAIYLLNITVEN